MTQHQLYHGLNNRWRRRAAQLYRLGFRYTCVGAKLLEYLGESEGFEPIDHPQVQATLKCVPRDIPIAYFERKTRWCGGRAIVPAALLHHTHNREWPHVLAQVLRR